MGFRHPVKAKDREQLILQSNPIAANQPEALAWVFFDTQNYVDATTVRLQFFRTTSTDFSITNMESGGQLPEPQFFEIYYFGCDILRDVTFDAVADNSGAWNDIQSLVLTSRPVWTFNISNKAIGPFPLSFCHQSGGVIGFAAATFVAPAKLQYGLNGPQDGGFCTDGSITIPPKVGFDVTVQWPAAVNITADVNVRFWMAGTLHRRVL